MKLEESRRELLAEAAKLLCQAGDRLLGAATLCEADPDLFDRAADQIYDGWEREIDRQNDVRTTLGMTDFSDLRRGVEAKIAEREKERIYEASQVTEEAPTTLKEREASAYREGIADGRALNTRTPPAPYDVRVLLLDALRALDMDRGEDFQNEVRKRLAQHIVGTDDRAKVDINALMPHKNPRRERSPFSDRG